MPYPLQNLPTAGLFGIATAVGHLAEAGHQDAELAMAAATRAHALLEACAQAAAADVEALLPGQEADGSSDGSSEPEDEESAGELASSLARHRPGLRTLARLLNGLNGLSPLPPGHSAGSGSSSDSQVKSAAVTGWADLEAAGSAEPLDAAGEIAAAEVRESAAAAAALIGASGERSVDETVLLAFRAAASYAKNSPLSPGQRDRQEAGAAADLVGALAGRACRDADLARLVTELVAADGSLSAARVAQLEADLAVVG